MQHFRKPIPSVNNEKQSQDKEITTITGRDAKISQIDS